MLIHVLISSHDLFPGDLRLI